MSAPTPVVPPTTQGTQRDHHQNRRDQTPRSDSALTRRPLRILITGSRSWTERATITQAISDYLHTVGTSITTVWPLPVIVHGGARGADQLAESLARAWGWRTEAHPADWQLHGRAAGYRRNAQMITLGADVCLAFIHHASPGATHTAALAQQAGIPTHRYPQGSTPCP